MDTVDKDRAILEWITQGGTYPIMFNFLPGEPSSYAFVPMSAERDEKRYFSGAQRRYDFAFQLMAPLSQTTDDVNTQSMYAMRKWQDWIDAQEAAKNYPDFGPKCSSYRLKNLSNMPQLAMAYTENQMAKYQFMAVLHYYESK